MKIGIAGMGAIGLRVAQELDQGGIPDCTLAGFSARSAPRAEEANAQLSTPVPCYELGEISDHCDLVIETLPPALFNDLAVPVLTGEQNADGAVGQPITGAAGPAGSG